MPFHFEHNEGQSQSDIEYQLHSHSQTQHQQHPHAHQPHSHGTFINPNQALNSPRQADYHLNPYGSFYFAPTFNGSNLNPNNSAPPLRPKDSASPRIVESPSLAVEPAPTPSEKFNGIDLNKEQLDLLERVLPSGYCYYIDSFTWNDTNLGYYTTTIRANVFTEENMLRWFKEYERLNRWIFRETKASYVTGKRVLYSKRFHCRHSNTVRLKQGKEKMALPPKRKTRNTNCESKVTLRLYNSAADDRNEKGKQPSRNLDELATFPAEASLTVMHNHQPATEIEIEKEMTRVFKRRDPTDKKQEVNRLQCVLDSFVEDLKSQLPSANARLLDSARAFTEEYTRIMNAAPEDSYDPEDEPLRKKQLHAARQSMLADFLFRAVSSPMSTPTPPGSTPNEDESPKDEPIIQESIEVDTPAKRKRGRPRKMPEPLRHNSVGSINVNGLPRTPLTPHSVPDMMEYYDASALMNDDFGLDSLPQSAGLLLEHQNSASTSGARGSIDDDDMLSTFSHAISDSEPEKRTRVKFEDFTFE